MQSIKGEEGALIQEIQGTKMLMILMSLGSSNRCGPPDYNTLFLKGCLNNVNLWRL